MSRRICPHCGEPIPAPVMTCTHCGSWVGTPVLVFLVCMAITIGAIIYVGSHIRP